MRDVYLFQMALCLESPWYVDRTEFDVEAKRLDLYLDFRQGGRFTCPECGEGGCADHDTTEKIWLHLHLDFFQHEAFLHARVPQVSCDGCGVKLVEAPGPEVPWARTGSVFTLLFEALVLALGKSMPVAAVARLVGETDTRLWRVLHHYVDQARAEVSHAEVRRVGVDETSLRRGHEYLTLVVELDETRVIFPTEGRESDTSRAFREDLEAHGGRGDWIREVCLDMSPAYRKGLRDHLPEANVTFDRFHVVKLLNEAVDQVRRAERKEAPELSRTRYLWLRNTTLLKQQLLDSLLLQHTHLRTVTAYQIQLALQDFWALPAQEASRFPSLPT